MAATISSIIIFIIVAAVIIFVIMIILYHGWGELKYFLRSIKFTGHTTGYIVDFEYSTDMDNFVQYTEIVEYIVDGKAYRFLSTTYTTENLAGLKAKHLNTLKKIRYDVKNPEDCCVGKNTKSMVILFFLVIVIAVLVCAIIYVMIVTELIESFGIFKYLNS